ncbi:septum formation protein Maf [Candidatus Saccharibacteria bacterium]|jgi:septum formation protein|nr:septum formation protein Maf [Candidatus Saccharibacteria bacterium]
MKIILASQSPRRRELLALMGVDFDVITSNFDEKLDDSRDASVVAKELALGKAMIVAEANPDAYVIGADTIVTVNGRQLEKPTSEENAHELLKALSDTVNYVTTGLVVLCIRDNVRLMDADTAAVYFGPYDAQAVKDYIATGDPMDKAGAYSIQKLYGTMITRIEGSCDGIMGLPTAKLASLLSQCGIAATAVEISPENVTDIV